jgi:CheY-like chemotaxis protein
VAEDVEINQFLVKHLLDGWGCTVSIAPDGIRAVEMVSSDVFDLVLMDIQMPAMDGIEATRVIREMNDNARCKIPIIALTANALKGDDEKYIAAGMNGYLTKPFTEKSLYSVIVKVLRKAKRIGETMDQTWNFENERPGYMNVERPYNLNSLDSLSGGDPSFLPMMAKLFVDTVPPVLAKMQEAFKSKDWKTVGAMAHKLKPTIDAMNITSLLEIVRQTELQGKQETELDSLEEKIEKIQSTLELCMQRLKQEFSL